MQPPDAEPNKSDTDERRKVLLALFLLLLTQTRDKMTSLVSAYLAGTLQTEHVTEGLLLLLTDAHAMAVSLGRQMAGGSGSNIHQNRQFALAVMVTQTGPLANLVHALRAGRYTVGPDAALPKLLAIRIRMYVRVLRNTADEAWIRSLHPDTLIEWVTTPREHCKGCLRMEASNPHRAGDMTEFPGDEECGPNCGCFLRFAGGGDGFVVPEDL